MNTPLRFVPLDEQFNKYTPNKRAANPAMMDALVKPIAERHGLALEDLKGPRRARRYAYPRFEAMHVLMREGAWSSLTVGKYLGGRDHATILHGCRRYEALREAAE